MLFHIAFLAVSLWLISAERHDRDAYEELNPNSHDRQSAVTARTVTRKESTKLTTITSQK